MRGSVIEERAKFTAARGVFEFSQRLRLDLTNAFALHRELLADFFERVVGVHAYAEAHAEYRVFPTGFYFVHFAIQEVFSAARMFSQSLTKSDHGACERPVRSCSRRAVAR